MEPVKLVVAGPSGAGKSTLLGAITASVVRARERSGAQVEVARLSIGRDLGLYLCALPDEPVEEWSDLCEGMLASVVVIDGQRPDQVHLALSHLRWFLSKRAPTMVALNRGGPDAATAAADLGVPPARMVTLDCASRDAVRELLVVTLKAALKRTTPTVLTSSLQAGLA